jgi:hypothetical protein
MGKIGRNPRRGWPEPQLQAAAVRAAGQLLATLGSGDRE